MTIYCKFRYDFVIFVYYIVALLNDADYFSFFLKYSADGGVIALRGHSKGVTDILFSRYNPLIFSVSKDTTMRAWKAMDYRCGAVYR